MPLIARISTLLAIENYNYYQVIDKAVPIQSFN